MLQIKFEINFLKTFLCSKKKFKVPKKSKNTFLHYIYFLRLCDMYTCIVQWDERQRASGHLKIKFVKIVRSQKKVFYWDIVFENRMFTLYTIAIALCSSLLVA
jgi:hypothetical protein